ncbi:helix-turn-helix domain-containing protein [Streptomyces sp. AJS327]|uniref:helix-turn-helix domain-containing protein n=1 Tax=Streptomyces sp. AJS327 TaxID=2545265 RepID=UPI0015DDE5CE|nr:helix-turn-helix domain-containing protein [Streptomyces sp. AJS327]
MMNISGGSREHLLRVLLDTAADLATLRDVEAQLQAIVRRTRSVVGADMAYISLNDRDRGETYIRWSEGVTTTAYRTLRMPLGEGVLGQAATGLAPYRTSGYLEDEALVHSPEVDEIVRGEGVQSIMGAPLTVEGRVIGALVVAERRRRQYTPEEVGCVESIGKQAAVALDNSLRFEELTRFAERLEAQERRAAAELALATRVLDLDRRLMQAVMAEPDVRRVLALGAREVGTALRLRGPGGGPVASTTDAPGDGGPGTPGPGGDGGGGGEAIAVDVTAAGEHLGTLECATPVDEAGRALLERVSVHVALALLFARAAEDADLRRGHDLLDDLLAGREVPRERLARRMHHWGLRPGDRLWSVAVAVPRDAVHTRLRALHAALGPGALTAQHGDHVCLVTSDPRWEARLRRAFADHGWPVRAGVGGPADGVRELPDAHQRAELALGSLSLLGRDEVMDGGRLGMLGALLDLAGRGGLPGSLTAGVDPLVAYDERHGTDLVRTAFCYLETDGNVARTAELLHVHRNTVRQRLDRTRTLLGPDWDASPRRLETHLALRVRDARVGLRP